MSDSAPDPSPGADTARTPTGVSPDSTPGNVGPAEVVRPDVVQTAGAHGDFGQTAREATGEAGPVAGQVTTEVPEESVTQPAKVMRIGSMVKQLLEEVRTSSLDEASRERLAEVYERSVVELSDALSPDLQEELRSLALPFDHDEVPSEAELRVAKAQLVGWLEGLFHGIQASMMAQQAMMQAQMAQQQQRALATGQTIPGQTPQQPADRPGTYL